MRFIQLIAAAALLISVMVGESGAQATPDDRKEIMALLENLSAHSIKPSAALDPSLDEQKRERTLGYFSNLDYQLNLQPLGAIALKGSDSATIPVRVEFKTINRELQASSSASFVKRSGQWYFANYDFLSIPAILIVITIVSVIIGIAYATIVLLLVRKLLRSGKLDPAVWPKIFIPIFWPSLFRAG